MKPGKSLSHEMLLGNCSKLCISLGLGGLTQPNLLHRVVVMIRWPERKSLILPWENYFGRKARDFC